ncbi:MAG: hypothetical protein ACN6O3_17290 [Comamonas sp.]
MKTWLRKLLHTAAALVLAPLLLFEEWGWEPLQRLAQQLTRLPLWGRLEAWIQRQPPWAALALFAAPALLLLPVKLLLLLLIGHGHVLLGMSALVGAKLLGTALVAWLFQLVQPTLMRLPWFARWYPRWVQWKDGVLGAIRNSRPWRIVRVLNRAALRLLHHAWQWIRR